MSEKPWLRVPTSISNWPARLELGRRTSLNDLAELAERPGGPSLESCSCPSAICHALVVHQITLQKCGARKALEALLSPSHYQYDPLTLSLIDRALGSAPARKRAWWLHLLASVVPCGGKFLMKDTLSEIIQELLGLIKKARPQVSSP